MEDKQGTELLYNISILKTYTEYLQKYYPDVNVDEVLKSAGITRLQLEDSGCWYSQEVSDRFHDAIDKFTNNPAISRDAGRYVASSRAYGTIRDYIRGFIGPATAYKLLSKIHAKVSRGASIEVNKFYRGKVEVVVTPVKGVVEKPYQCENRIGQFEAIAAGFTGHYAQIEHPECLHRGDKHCRYHITWKEPRFLTIRRYRNYILIFSVLAVTLAFPSLSQDSWINLILSLVALTCGVTFASWFLEKDDYRRQLEDQSRSAELLISESNARYQDACLVQEVGQVISKYLDIDTLLETIMHTLNKHLNFDRGVVMLANKDRTRLVFRAGYGITDEQQDFLRQNSLHLDKPHSKGPLVRAFKDKEPYFIEDVSMIFDDLSQRSQTILKFSQSTSFICVPIVFEEESLGVLAVDKVNLSKTPLRQNDLNLLKGIAPQIAISIMNARSYERLQASEEKYRDLVESANSIIMRLDTQGRISFVNTYAKELYGYEEHEMIGREVLGFLMPPIDAKGNDFSLVFADFLENPDDYRQLINMNILKNGESVWISWSNKAIFDKDGNLSEILCVGSDITQRKMAEEEKARLEMQLQRSQKMEAIGMLAGGVAHDLNNILSGVVSYPEILLMEVPEGSSMRKSLEVIKRSGEKAAAIVQDLLTLARRGLNISNVVNLNSVIREFIKSPECNRILEYHKNVRCELNLDPDLMNILGSEVHLSKTLMNLISNAAEAMTSGGVVTVATENRYVDSLIHGYDLIEEGEYAVMIVSDTGIGIPPENLKRIFEPFYSKKVMGRSGTGLGMAVIWSTVKDHHGYIDARSTVGEGTCFELYFPITRRELKDDDVAGPLDALRGTEKILVIDDVDDQREIARKLLEKLGYTVDVAACGEDALKYLSESRADLILLDMIMDPGIDGLETYRRILKIRPGQKAIIVSGFSESDRVKETLDLGAGTYVKKPYRLHDMARAIRSELDRKR